MGACAGHRKSATMSYGGMASTVLMGGSMAASMIAAKLTHNMVIGSGTQPTTICSEFQAGTVLRSLGKPMESNPDKRMLQNPIYNTSSDWETGRANTFGRKQGESIVMMKDAE